MTARRSRKSKTILLINGHPDPRPERLCAGLAKAYAASATAAGHVVHRIDVGALEFPLIRSQDDFLREAPLAIADIQRILRAADHLVIIHPLWLGRAPAKLKAFLEQVFRYGVALSPPGEPMRRLLRGKSARVVVTMGMPASVFRWVFGAAGLRSLALGLLWLSGMRPVRHWIVGGVEGRPATERQRWLAQMERMGALGQ